MGKIILLSMILSSAAQAAEKAGMPQLDPTTWFPQIFWLIITFAFLYIVISKVVLPKLSETIEQRNDHISDHIDEASSLKNQAEEKYKEYIEVIAIAKKEAQDLIAENKKKLQNNFDNNKKKINLKLEKKLKEVDQEIKIFKKEAASNIENISKEIAKELVKTVSKIDTNDASAGVIVNEVSKKYLKELN
jgi:F-type H+-transporting ATPase subunit b